MSAAIGNGSDVNAAHLPKAYDTYWLLTTAVKDKTTIVRMTLGG